MSADAYQILPLDLMGAYLVASNRFAAEEFGADGIVSVDRLQDFYRSGTLLFSLYGHFTDTETVVRAAARCFLISETAYAAMITGQLQETAITPWTPADGQAVLWIGAILSTITGGAAHAITGLVDALEKNQHLQSIKTIAAYVTGPKGFMFAEACGLRQRTEQYEDGMPFFEMPFDVAALTRASEVLARSWNHDVAREKLQKFKEQRGGIVMLRDGRVV